LRRVVTDHDVGLSNNYDILSLYKTEKFLTLGF
jgi:hypothetical protein